MRDDDAAVTLAIISVVLMTVATIGIIRGVLRDNKQNKEEIADSPSYDKSKILVLNYDDSKEKDILIYSDDLEAYYILGTEDFISADTIPFENVASLNNYLLPEQRHDYYSIEELLEIESQLEKDNVSLVRKLG